MRFYIWPGLTFDKEGVGSRVLNVQAFLDLLAIRVAGTEFPECGIAKIDMAEAIPYVSAGVGPASTNPDDYVLREYRGRVQPFLKRELAAEATSLTSIVYQAQAYVDDPEVSDEERSDIYQQALEVGLVIDPSRSKEEAIADGMTKVFAVVSVRAEAGPECPMGSTRLVENLAGGNNDVLAWDADRIKEEARASCAYEQEWSVVAD